MTNPLPQQISNELKIKIIEAAEKRFNLFGYQKTTMAEISQDVNMSAANLYRYYENKQSIGVACVIRCLSEREKLLRTIANECKLNIQEQLEHFVLTSLEFTYNLVSEQPRIRELVDTITKERYDVIRTQLDIERSLIVKMIKQGVQNGEFSVSDSSSTADAFLNATIKFRTPWFLELHSIENLKSQARDVLKLILDGIKSVN